MGQKENTIKPDTYNGLTLPMLELMAMAVSRTLQGIILTDQTGTILYVNPAFTVSTGYEADEAIGKNPSILQSGKHDAAFYKEMWETVALTGQWQGEIWNRRKNGEIYIEWLNVSAIYGPDGAATHYCAVFSDITERILVEYKLKAENRKLEQLVMLDALTGVGNRRAFDLILRKEWVRGMRSKEPLSVLLVDIDFFKLYNDMYGHQQGDEALRRVGSVMNGIVHRSSDLLARYGGEEFAVILPGMELEEAVRIGQTLREQVASARIPHKGSSISPYITISVGCATAVPSAEGKSEDLVLAADNALYAAKEKGRNRVQIRA